ncbi:MAG: sulfotransferase domain-containing protein, partial [Calditrichaeota bacterium]
MLRHLFRRRQEPQIYLISYPKTGRTWLRALIGKALCERYGLSEEQLLDTEALTATAGLPRAVFTHDGSAMKEQKSYRELSPDKRFYRDKKVVLLGRDVRDTLVSAYFQATRRIHVFEGTMSEFIRDERFGAIKMLTFYRYWYENREVPAAFLLLRYEELHRDTAGWLKKVLHFMGAGHIPEAIIDRAVEFCQFENMRRAEMENRFGSARLSPRDVQDPESFKVRRG